MRKLLLITMILSASTAHAGFLDIVGDVAKQVSPDAVKAIDVWEKDKQRKQDAIDAKEAKEERQQALVEEKRLAEQQRIADERKRKEAKVKYKTEKADRDADKKELRIAELEAKLKLAEQRAAKEKLDAQARVQKVHERVAPQKAETKPVVQIKKTITPVNADEIKRAVKSIDVPSNYAKAMLMIKTASLDNSYEEYMNFGEWVARVKRQKGIKKMWTKGGTFTDLELYIKRSGRPSGGIIFYEDEGEVFLRALICTRFKSLLSRRC